MKHNEGDLTEVKLQPCRQEAVHERIRKVRREFSNKTYQEPTKIFISVELIEQLLVEFLGANKANVVAVDPNAKNEIDGMTAYRVIEPGIISVSL